MQIGVIIERVFLISRHDRPIMLSELSIRKTVSNCVKKAYLESAVVNIRPEITAVKVAGE
jgi:hypothetical protein